MRSGILSGFSKVGFVENYGLNGPIFRKVGFVEIPLHSEITIPLNGKWGLNRDSKWNFENPQ